MVSNKCTPTERRFARPAASVRVSGFSPGCAPQSSFLMKYTRAAADDSTWVHATHVGDLAQFQLLGHLGDEPVDRRVLSACVSLEGDDVSHDLLYI